MQDALVPEGTKAITNVAAFTNSNFTRNTSPTGGSAVQLVSSSLVNQVLATTDFTNWYVAILVLTHFTTEYIYVSVMLRVVPSMAIKHKV